MLAQYWSYCTWRSAPYARSVPHYAQHAHHTRAQCRTLDRDRGLPDLGDDEDDGDRDVGSRGRPP
eukprot:2095823-Rhodomonas_salina.1